MISKKISSLIGTTCGIIVLFLGIVFVVSLLLSKISLIQLAPNFTPIKFNTVLCFLLAGLALLGLINSYNRLAVICGFVILFISGLTLLQYALGVNWGIDQFFLHSAVSQPVLFPGRMAPITAWGFFLSALISIGIISKLKWYYYFSRCFAACITIIGIMSLFGYLIGVEFNYHFGWFSAMSPQAAIIFIILGVGFSTYAWHDELVSNKNTFAISLALSVAFTILFFSIVLAMVNIKRDKEELILRIEEEGQLVKHLIINEMNYSIRSLRRMALRWDVRSGIPESEWRSDVQNYMADTKAVQLILWADKDEQIKWWEPLDIQQVESLINFDEANNSLLQRQESSSIILTSPVRFKNQYLATVAFIPLKVNDVFQGYIVGVYDSERLVANALSVQIYSLYNITIKEGDKLIYGLDIVPDSDNDISFVFQVFNKNWTLIISPKKEFFDQNQSILPYLELLSGVLFSLLIGSTLYYAFTATRRNRLLMEKSEALAQSERRQQQLVDDVHDYAIFWLDLEGKVETWNCGAERLYGYNSHEIIKKNFSCLFSQDDNQSALSRKVLDKAVLTGKFEGETEFTCKNLDKFWASLVIEVLKNSDNTLIGFAVIVRDISQQRLLEQERSKLVSIIEESPDFIGMADLSGNLLFHNRSAKRMIGLDEHADLSMMKIANIHPSWAFDLIYNQAIPCVFNQGSWTGETAVLNQKTGQDIPVLQTLILHRTPLGEPICFTTVIRDITERKKTEAALKNSEEIFRSSMEHAAIGMALVSTEGGWLKVNKALCDMLGYTEEEFLKMDFQTITHPDDLQQDMDCVNAMLERKMEKYFLEKRYFRKDGSIVWISLNVSLAWQTNGEPNYFIVQIQNITDRKQAEVAQERLMAQLTNSNMELERFAYVASHDMQEPLRMVVCFSDILMKDFGAQLEPEAKDYLSIVSDSGKRMQEMIQDLLEYSRISSETRLFKPVNGEVALDSALGNIKIPIEESNAEISFEQMPNFLGNPIQIMRLLQNLIINAIKYRAKDLTPKIHVGVKSNDKEWCIFVQDNGLGIPKEFAEQIFQPFRRLQTWNTVKGTGLGLAICKKIVENHGGKIWVEPAPKQGSIFYFTLPKTN